MVTDGPHPNFELQVLHLGLESTSYALCPEVLDAFHLAVVIWVRCIALQGTEHGIVTSAFMRLMENREP